MSKVTKDNRHQKVVRHNDGSVEVWQKNSAGCTTKEGYERYNPGSGNTSNYWGRITKTGGRSGHTKPKR